MTNRTIIIALTGISLVFGMLGLMVSFYCCWKQRHGELRFRFPGRATVRVGGGLVLISLVAGYATWRHRIAGEYSVPYHGDAVQAGRNASLGGHTLFPVDHPWNTRVDRAPKDSMSDAFINVIGADTPLHPDFGTGRLGYHLYGIPYVVVDGSQTKQFRLRFDFASESDDIFYPIPSDPPIEDGGDHHLLILDRNAWRLYELFNLTRTESGWRAGSGASWDLHSVLSRPNGWTSADAAGLQMLPGLARADEVYDRGAIEHALRFGLEKTASAHRYPARHDASESHATDLPPMGLRLRLKASIRAESFPPGAAVIVRALQQYGMILADNAGPLYLGGTADRRWKREDTRALYRLKASDFEAVATIPPPLGDTVAWHEAPWKKPPP